MMQASFRAMGTTVEAWFAGTADVTPIAAWFEEVEGKCSRFRPDSELSQINSLQASRTQVSGMMWEVLTEADRARSLTGGLVDVGVGSAVAGWGYDRTFAEVVDTELPGGVFETPRWSLHPPARALARSVGTTLDLGGIAKGWACDRAVELGLADVVSAGGDIRSADPGTIATILDQHGCVATRVRLGMGALATSSVMRRRWRAGDRQVSHLVDPRTMEPVETPVLSSTVIARSAVDAEIGAKAVLILGADGLAWADSRDWIHSAIVLWHDGSIYATSGTEVAA
jgi:thiamine biosynthesis lipoprotein